MEWSVLERAETSCLLALGDTHRSAPPYQNLPQQDTGQLTKSGVYTHSSAILGVSGANRDLRLSASNFCFTDLQGALFSGIRAAREVNEAVN
jgi:hypothetical protein